MTAAPPEPPQPQIDPAEALKSLWSKALAKLAETGGLLGAALAFVPIFVYFSVYWRYKDQIRRVVRKSALWVLMITLALFLFEVVMKAYGKDLLAALQAKYAWADTYLFGGFVLCGLVVLKHNWTEARHDTAEAKLAEALWRYFHLPSGRKGIQEPSLALSVVHAAFSRHGVARVCLWRKIGDQMKIADGEWYPLEQHVDLLRSLPPNVGIASLVHADRLPRYVPRVFFPFNSKRLRRFLSWQFKHALVFKAYNPTGEMKDFDVRGHDLSPNAVEFPDDSIPRSMRSFLAVPVCSVEKNECSGVICIEFQGTDPLDTGSIKMGAMLGALLYQEGGGGAATAVAARAQ